MSYETIDFEVEPFSEDEVNARFAQLMDAHPRMDPREAERESIKALRWKYDMLSDGGGRVET